MCAVAVIGMLRNRDWEMGQIVPLGSGSSHNLALTNSSVGLKDAGG